MSRRRPAEVFLFLALATSISAAETWPGRLGESDKICLVSLRDADAVVRNPRAEARVELFEKLRTTLDLCDRPEVDSRFAARAVRLAMILPEYSTPSSQIEALSAAVRRLEELSPPPPELIRTLDDLTGPLYLSGRPTEVRTVLNRLVDLRRETFGERSFEAAQGILHLAMFHASEESSGPAYQPELARALGIDAVQLVAQRPDCGVDYFRILGAYTALLETLGKHEAATELGLLFHRIEAAERSRTSDFLERWDEPLPEP